MRHIALNLLPQETSLKLGVKNKRLQARWDEDYLLKILVEDAFALGAGKHDSEKNLNIAYHSILTSLGLPRVLGLITV
ncbi:hypothetical protein H6F89_19860 [Cyanobacteria bacterium FACHB-63]|nr:hypothetical protein [Cyanobacteria bacterium FACHB-63]